MTVMLKGQSPTVKVSVFNIPISNCNSIIRSGDSNGVTMELKIKVEYSWAYPFDPLIPCFYYTG